MPTAATAHHIQSVSEHAEPAHEPKKSAACAPGPDAQNTPTQSEFILAVFESEQPNGQAVAACGRLFM